LFLLRMERSDMSNGLNDLRIQKKMHAKGLNLEKFDALRITIR
jgi:hypothetical protein